MNSLANEMRNILLATFSNIESVQLTIINFYCLQCEQETEKKFISLTT